MRAPTLDEIRAARVRLQGFAVRTPLVRWHEGDGEVDTRVPTQNAYELFQGLQDQGVPTKLIIYKGFSHVISKPKEQLAAVWHNWQWFGKYIFGENIEIPIE